MSEPFNRVKLNSAHIALHDFRARRNLYTAQVAWIMAKRAYRLDMIDKHELLAIAKELHTYVVNRSLPVVRLSVHYGQCGIMLMDGQRVIHIWAMV